MRPNRAGVTDRDVLDAVEFYSQRRLAPTRTDPRNVCSLSPLMTFDAFHLDGELLSQLLQVIVAGRLGTTLQFKDGKQLFERATYKQDMLVMDGLDPCDLWNNGEYVYQAIERLAGS